MKGMSKMGKMLHHRPPRGAHGGGGGRVEENSVV